MTQHTRLGVKLIAHDLRHQLSGDVLLALAILALTIAVAIAAVTGVQVRP